MYLLLPLDWEFSRWHFEKITQNKISVAVLILSKVNKRYPNLMNTIKIKLKQLKLN